MLIANNRYLRVKMKEKNKFAFIYHSFFKVLHRLFSTHRGALHKISKSRLRLQSMNSH